MSFNKNVVNIILIFICINITLENSESLNNEETYLEKYLIEKIKHLPKIQQFMLYGNQIIIWFMNHKLEEKEVH